MYKEEYNFVWLKNAHCQGCLVLKCFLSKNLGYEADGILCFNEQCNVRSLFHSDSVIEVKVRGWVLKAVNCLGHCLERQVGLPLLGRKAVSLLQQVVAAGSPEDHGLEVVNGYQE